MGSATKFTNTRRRNKAAKKAENLSKDANKKLARLKKLGFNKSFDL